MSIIFILISILLFSCQNEIKDDSSFKITSYNLYCFFDGSDDGFEFNEFKHSNGYTNDSFLKRVESLSSILKKTPFSSSDIIFFQELENENVLEYLLDDSLRRRGFIYYGVAKCENQIAIGFISKLKVNEIYIHSFEEFRPFMQVKVRKNGREYSIYSLHAKSNIGAEEDVKEHRRKLARHLLSLIENDENVIILGDFNSQISYGDDLLSYNKSSSSIQCTISIDSASKDIFYDASEDVSLPLKAPGSYYYDDKWYYYDKILVNSDILAEIKSYHFDIIALNELLNNSYPYKYDVKTQRGYSDHLAISMELKY